MVHYICVDVAGVIVFNTLGASSGDYVVNGIPFRWTNICEEQYFCLSCVERTEPGLSACQVLRPVVTWLDHIPLTNTDQRTGNRNAAPNLTYHLTLTEEGAPLALVTALCGELAGADFDDKVFNMLFSARRNLAASLDDTRFELMRIPTRHAVLNRLAQQEYASAVGRCLRVLISHLVEPRKVAAQASAAMLAFAGPFFSTWLWSAFLASLLLMLALGAPYVFLRAAVFTWTMDPVVTVLVIVVLNPFWEEYLLRRAQPVLGSYLTSVLFVLSHLPSGFPTTLAATMITVVRMTCPGLPTLCIHLCWNGALVCGLASPLARVYRWATQLTPYLLQSRAGLYVLSFKLSANEIAAIEYGLQAVPWREYVLRNVRRCVLWLLAKPHVVSRVLHVARRVTVSVCPNAAWLALCAMCPSISGQCAALSEVDAFYSTCHTSPAAYDWRSAAVDDFYRLPVAAVRLTRPLFEMACASLLLSLPMLFLWRRTNHRVYPTGLPHGVCCRGGCTYATNSSKTIRMRLRHSSCGKLRPYQQVGPDLPFHHPWCFSPCTDNLTLGILKRMVETPVDPARVFPDREALMSRLFGTFCDELDHSPLMWDWQGFLHDKPAKVRARAANGRASLERKGYVFSSHGWTTGDEPIDKLVSLFVKREFSDYMPYDDKSPKPRIISCCSDEVLALLGPFMHSIDVKMRTMLGMAKHLAPSCLGPFVKSMKVTAERWKRHLLSTDFECFDRTQDAVLLRFEHAVYAALGLPPCALSFLSTYDVHWVAVARVPSGKKRIVALDYASDDGVRKSGDPHTSVGNNLLHWCVVRMFLSFIGDSSKDAVFLVNGDDFIGCFAHADFRRYSSFVAGLGLKVARCEPYEFCGGYYLGEDCIFVRDPSRALPKIGWSLNPTAEPSGYLKSSLLCETYLASHNPILASYISYHLKRLSTSVAVPLPPVQLESICYRLYRLWKDSTPTIGSPEFSLLIGVDVRADYSERFGVSYAAQLLAERTIAETGCIPNYLGRLLE
jgi:hypothetical protein